MILLTFLLFLINISSFSVQWLNINIDSLILQTLLLYFILRLSIAVNLYQLVGYSTLTLISISSLLFWLQFDVFACFLLVAESIVLLFVLSILMHMNYTNSSKFSLKPALMGLVLVIVTLNYQVAYTSFTYWVDWYVSQTSQYNDLLPQYIYFYLLDSPVVILTGIWLLVLTLLLVQLILSLSFSRTTSTTEVSYFRKTQSIWAQWYKKPIIRFFNK